MSGSDRAPGTSLNSSLLSSVNGFIPRSLSSFTQGSRYGRESSMEPRAKTNMSGLEPKQFTSRFLKTRTVSPRESPDRSVMSLEKYATGKNSNLRSVLSPERYSANGNLGLRQMPQSSSEMGRSAGLRGVLDRLGDNSSINRSSSGSSHGSANSSGYYSSAHRTTNNNNEDLKGKHIEYEDTDSEAADPIVVNGGIDFVKSDTAVVNNRSKEVASAPRELRKSQGKDVILTDNKNGLSTAKLSTSIADFIKRTDHYAEDWKMMGKKKDADINKQIAEIDDGNNYRLGPSLRNNRSMSVAPTSMKTEYSRDPFYAPYADERFREGSVPASPYADGRYREGSVPARGITSRNLGPIKENKILSPLTPQLGRSMMMSPATDRSRRTMSPGMDSSLASTLFSKRSPSKSKRERGLTLEEECNWILSGKTPQVNDLQNGADDEDENTLDDISGDELSEMTADLAEEHSTAVLATERLETEQSDRMKLEKERSELQARNKHLVSSSEQMQMELLYSRGSEINGAHDSDDEEGSGIYRAKYERSMKELEYTKKRLQQQHEDDMDQLMCLKKQLEKKLNDAYEEVDEQRQVVGQWKRKAQKIQGEMNDTRLLLEEQTSRNALLEKKQRKFDSELGLAHEDKRQETLSKEKLQKELDSLKQVKHSLEDQIHAMKLDTEFKEEKLSALQRELSELQDTGVADDEVRQLKKLNHDLEMRLKDQEEELDDLAGQVQLLESSKTKLEMQMAQIKKEQRREIQSKEDELEDARAAANKKVKVLEQQLEQEHEERIGFLRERHELEGKIMTLQDMLERAGDEEQLAKLRKDLKRTKALLRDAQLMIEKSHNEGSNKVMIRQLKNQLEDAEFTRTAAMKARQNAELELADVQQQLDDMIRAKNDLEDRHLKLSREKAEYAGQLQENEEDLQEVMKKYKASVNAVTTDQITIQDQAASIADLEAERNKLRETVAELSIKVESMEGENVTTTQHKRLELKIRELESKLELEQTTRGRLETQISRLKEAIEKLNSEADQLRVKEQTSQEGAKKVGRQLRDLKEDYSNIQTKETEMSQKKSDLEKQLEISEGETVTAKNELKLATKRIEDLQIAIAGEIDTDETNSEDNSESSDEEMHSFLEHHRRAMSVQRERESIARESVMRDSVSREIRASMAREISVGRDSSVSRDFSVGRDSSVTRDFAVGRSLPTTTIREEPDFTSSPNNSITEGDESQA